MTASEHAAATYETYQILRTQAKMTDSDVSRASGVSRSTFTGWKAGRWSPKYATLKAIAEVLGVDPRLIMEG